MAHIIVFYVICCHFSLKEGVGGYGYGLGWEDELKNKTNLKHSRVEVQVEAELCNYLKIKYLNNFDHRKADLIWRMNVYNSF